MKNKATNTPEHKKKITSFRLTSDEKNMIETISKEQNINQSEVIRKALAKLTS